MEAPKDQVMIRVVSGVLGRNFLEETEVLPQDIVCPVIHLPPHPCHAPCYPLADTGALAQKKVRQHII